MRVWVITTDAGQGRHGVSAVATDQNRGTLVEAAQEHLLACYGGPGDWESVRVGNAGRRSWGTGGGLWVEATPFDIDEPKGR